MSFQLIHRYSELENSFFSMLHSHLYKQMHGKMARTLLYLNSFNTDCNVLNLWIEKTLPVCIRKHGERYSGLKSFETDGLIEIRDKEIHILNETPLRISSKGLIHK